jgi:hypothetical protein
MTAKLKPFEQRPIPFPGKFITLKNPLKSHAGNIIAHPGTYQVLEAHEYMDFAGKVRQGVMIETLDHYAGISRSCFNPRKVDKFHDTNPNLPKGETVMAPPKRPQNHPKRDLPKKPRRPQRGQGVAEVAAGSSPKQVPKSKTTRQLPRKPAKKTAPPVEVDIEETEVEQEVPEHEEWIGDANQQLLEGRRFSKRGGPPKQSREMERKEVFGTTQISVRADEAHMFQKWNKWDLDDWAAAFCVEIKRGDYDENLEAIIASINERCTDTGAEGIDFDEDEAGDGGGDGAYPNLMDADYDDDGSSIDGPAPISQQQPIRRAGGRQPVTPVKGSLIIIITPRRSQINGAVATVSRLNKKTVSGTILTGNLKGRDFRAAYSFCYQPNQNDMARYQQANVHP